MLKKAIFYSVAIVSLILASAISISILSKIEYSNRILELVGFEFGVPISKLVKDLEDYEDSSSFRSSVSFFTYNTDLSKKKIESLCDLSDSLSIIKVSEIPLSSNEFRKRAKKYTRKMLMFVWGIPSRKVLIIPF